MDSSKDIQKEEWKWCAPFPLLFSVRISPSCHFMFRSVISRHKVLSVLTLGAAASALPLVKEENRFLLITQFLISSVKVQDFGIRLHRTTYFARTVGSIILDYWWSFRNLEDGTPEEQEMEHIVNQRSAEHLFRMCEYGFGSAVTCSHLGGYFAKFGQIISTFDKGVPPEYVEVLKQCQVAAVHSPNL